ncbi:MAG: hypothetical protein PHT12_02915 [Patescibacteria group bacterium]|nr:hypothetical protein [Patescibacteria group bacterium]
MFKNVFRSVEWIKSCRLLPYLAVFALAVAYFAILQWQPAFIDPDSFYHAKMGELTMRFGLVRHFPWLPFTTLAQSFADHHYLYHLLLVPFIAAAGTMLGTKIATVVLAAAAIVCFYLLMRAEGVRYPALFTFLLATSGGFIFRLNLAKATALSVCLVFLSLLAIRRDRPRRLFLLAWLFVWSYGGWPIMIIVAGAFWLARLAVFIMERMSMPGVAGKWASAWRDFWRDRRLGWRGWTETRHALAIAAGLAAGLVVNPYFPRNLSFYWEQIVQIAVIGYQGVLVVGSEWYPYTMTELFGKTSVAFLGFSVGTVMLLAAIFWGRPRSDVAVEPKRFVRLAAAFFLALVFLLLSLRSRRHIEYFTPLALWFDALFITLVWPFFRPTNEPDDDNSDKRRFVAKFLFVYVLILAPIFAVRDGFGIRSLFMNKSMAWTSYGRVADWLRANVPAGEVVFHSEWDDFPVLFLQDDSHRYVSGLDPTFLYRRDRQKQQQYADITSGRLRSGLAKVIRDSFDSRFVVIEKDDAHAAMLANVEADPAFRLMYADDEASIFQIVP